MHKQSVIQEMHNIVDRNFHVPELNELMKICIHDKINEPLFWSEMTVLTFRMLGGVSNDIYRNAACTELIMLALDIMDDLQDRDNMQKPWMQIPSEYALNAMLGLLMGAMSEMPKQAAEIGRVINQAINGQHKDVAHLVQTEDEYVTMTMEKSASLVKLACYMGYSAIDDENEAVPSETIEVLDHIAQNIGMMGQLQNDLNDVLRFDLKNDILQKKRTLATLYLLYASKQMYPLFDQFYEGAVTRNELLLNKLECMAFIEQCGCAEYTQSIQQLYYEQSDELFAGVAALSPWKEQFKELAFAHYGN